MLLSPARKSAQAAVTLPSIEVAKTASALTPGQGVIFGQEPQATGANPSSLKQVAQTSTASTYLEAVQKTSKHFMKQDILGIDFPFKPITLVQGKPTISSNTLEKSQLLADLKFMLVGKFTHGRPPMSTIQKFFATLKLQGKFHLSIIDKKHISIECHSKSDFYFLWLKLNWSIKGYSMRIFKWDADFLSSKESSIAPVWIRISNLPLYFFEVKTLLSIANVIGKPILIDPKLALRTVFSSASFCVELDVTRPLIDSIRINLVDESSQVLGGFWASVSYNVVPPYCLACSHVGHGRDTCKRLIEAKDTRPTAALIVADGEPDAEKTPILVADQTVFAPALLSVVALQDTEGTAAPFEGEPDADEAHSLVADQETEGVVHTVKTVCTTRSAPSVTLAETVIKLQKTDAQTCDEQSTTTVDQNVTYAASPVVDKAADTPTLLYGAAVVGDQAADNVLLLTETRESNNVTTVDQVGMTATTTFEQKNQVRIGSDAAESISVSSYPRPAGKSQIWKEVKRSSPSSKRSDIYPNNQKQVTTNNSFSLLASAIEVEVVSTSNTESQSGGLEEFTGRHTAKNDQPNATEIPAGEPSPAITNTKTTSAVVTCSTHFDIPDCRVETPAVQQVDCPPMTPTPVIVPVNSNNTTKQNIVTTAATSSTSRNTVLDCPTTGGVTTRAAAKKLNLKPTTTKENSTKGRVASTFKTMDKAKISNDTDKVKEEVMQRAIAAALAEEVEDEDYQKPFIPPKPTTKDGCPAVTFKTSDLRRWMAKERARANNATEQMCAFPFDDKG